MSLYSQLDQAMKEKLCDNINKRWKQLYDLKKEWADRALKYLFLTNSGGAIATLGFIGTAKAATSEGTTKIALFLFIAGLILGGVMTAKTFHQMSGLHKRYERDVTRFYEDKITWVALFDDDKERAVKDYIDYILPYLSFGCFIFGCIAGAYSLFT